MIFYTHGFANKRIIDITRPYIPVDSATAAPSNIVEIISPLASGWFPNAYAPFPAAYPCPIPEPIPEQNAIPAPIADPSTINSWSIINSSLKDII